MERFEEPRKPLREELERLAEELEHSRTATQHAVAEMKLLSADRDALLDRADRLNRRVQDAERQIVLARAEAARSGELLKNLAHQENVSEALRTALEETSVLAEELQVSNEELLSANEELDRRVAERTAQVNRANTALERMNADLQRRIDAETAARSKAQAELFQMQKLEAIGQLTGGIAHDFNNLLTVITSGLQLLGQGRDAEYRARVLRRIEEAAWRGARLTQRLLAFARRQPLHPERLELQTHLEGMRELLAHTLRENVAMRVEVEAEVWPVDVDAAALELAVLNLAVNARDAMPNGGSLVLSAANQPLEPERAGRLGLARGDYVAVSVTDNGIGMPPEVLEKVFEPFFSTKETGKGTGLGLPQVYGFAKQSGGAAWVESRTGEGTAVHILLPRSRRSAPRQDAVLLPVGAAAASRSENLHVLVVEDDPSVAATVLDMLRALGHTGEHVDTIAAALAALSHAEKPDLVFSDVLLPGEGSGLDLAREMAARKIAIPLILTSGFGGGMTQRLAAANVPFLRKPYRIEALREAIDNTMQPPAMPVLQGATAKA